MNERICSISWCEKRVQSRGYCSMHYARSRKGLDMDVRPHVEFAAKFPCSVSGCDRRQKVKGYCRKHYSRLKNTGTTAGRGDHCKKDGCGSPIRARGMCRDHYLRSEGIELRIGALPKECRYPPCGDPSLGLGYCKRHYVMVQRYNVTPERWQDMFDSQSGKCPICQQALNLSNRQQIHIDHDHGCCDGYKSCGECVRSLLCSTCNKGLGTFSDDPQRLQRAIDYLSRGQSASKY